MSDKLSFFAELKRRKIVQWALAYLAAAWVLLQVLGLATGSYDWPHLVMQLAFGVVGLGFVVTLVLAWYHGERGAQRVSGVELLILALLLAIGGGLLWRSTQKSMAPALSAAYSHFNAPASTTRPYRGAPRTLGVASASEIPTESIAVLPLANESGDPGEQYFSDGLSEDLITALSQFAGLRVISRNSSFQFRDSKDDAKTIGDKLGVAHLLEGSVRRDGDTVRITAELVNAADGSTLWSKHYDRPYKNLFAMQDDITQAIADALKARLLATTDAAIRDARPPSGNLDAYDAWLQANFYALGLNETDLRRAIGEYGRAIALDPNYAQAFADRSYAWTTLASLWVTGQAQRDAYARGREDAHHALSLAPGLAAAHRALGYSLQWGSLDPVGAEAEYRKAVELAPDSAKPRMDFGLVLASLGRLEEGANQIRKAVQLDPLNARVYRALADIELGLGRFDEATQAIEKAIALRPDAATNRRSLVYIDIRRGDQATAMRHARQEPDPIYREWEIAMALQIGSDRAAADAALKRFVDKYADLGGFQIAEAYALRKEPDQAFAWLERAWAVRDPGIMELLYDPFLLAYKDDPRFAAFCRKVGLPAPGSVPAAAATVGTNTGGNNF